MPDSEKDIQSKAMIALQQAFPSALIARQNTGAAKDLSGNFIRFGLPGQGDIRMVYRGYAIEVEIKTPKGRQSQKQKDYQAALERAGGIYEIARSATEAVEKIKCRIFQRNSYRP